MAEQRSAAPSSGPWTKYQTTAPAPAGGLPPLPPGFQIVPAPAPTPAAPAAGPWERYATPPAPVVPPLPPGFQLDPPAAAPEGAGFRLQNPTPAPRSLGRHILDAGEHAVTQSLPYAIQETSRGAMDLLGLPVDLVNLLSIAPNLLPGEQGFTPVLGERPIGGGAWMYDNLVRGPSDFLAENAENPVRAALGIDPLPAGDRQPTNAAERIGGRVAQELGATVLPVAAVLSEGRKGVDAARKLPGLARFFVEPAAVAPRKVAADAARYATASGLGAGVLREVANDGDPSTTTPAEQWSDLVGSLVGASAFGLGEAVVPMVRNVVSAGSPRFADRVVREAVTDELLSNSRALGPRVASGEAVDADAVIQSLLQPSEAERVIPGYAATAGDRARDPGLATLEYARQSGPGAGLYAARREANTGAVSDAAGAVAPTGRTGALSERLEGERVFRIDQATEAAQAAGERFDAASARLRTEMDGEARGQVIRSALDDALGAARDVEREAWAGVRGTVDPQPLAAAFDGATRALSPAERLELGEARPFLAIPDELARGGAPASLEDVTTLRGSLTDRVRAAQAAGEPNRARILGRYVEALDGFLAGSVPQEAADALAQARRVSLDLNDRFTRRGSAIADALARNPSGGPSMPDSRVAPRFVQPDEAQGGEIARLLGEADTPEVRAAVRDQVLADVERRGLLGRPAELDAYLNQRGAVFARFPGLREELDAAAGLRRGADDARRRAEDVTATLTRPGRSAVASYLRYGSEDAERAMRTVLEADRPAAAADDLLSFVQDDPQAVQGARKAFWEVMERRSRSAGETTAGASGEQPWLPRKWLAFLDDHAGVAERLYRDDPEHLARLREIAGALQGSDLRSRMRAPNSSGTAQAISGRYDASISPATLQSRFTAVQRGQMSLPYFVTSIANTIARRRVERARIGAFNRLLDDALLDPEKAAALLTENNPANRAALARQLRLWYGERASNLVDMLGSDDGEDAGE